MGRKKADEKRPLAVSLPPALTEMEAAESRATADLGHCLVTGAAGFLGRSLVFELIRRGHRVRALDLLPIDYSHERLDVVEGDVGRIDDLRKACEGIDTVFHTAAVLDFVRFASAARRARSIRVNVGGVANMTSAAREAGVARMVHTSSNNATLDGPVIDGDESLPYAVHTRDLYTETKILGEQVALAANDPEGLLTCAIRPGGIYGPGDGLLLTRVVEECAGGRYVATIGDGSALSDNTFIDNLVDGQIEAARHLVPGSPLCGQAYYITDGAPINYFEFFRPFVEGLGYPHPRWKIPGRLMLGVATAWEFLHKNLWFPAPALTALEVRKITVSHYNRIDKARRDFGWLPKVGTDEAMERCVEYGRELLEARKPAAGGRAARRSRAKSGPPPGKAR